MSIINIPAHQEFIGRTLQKIYRQIHQRLVEELYELGYADITAAQAEVLACIRGEGSNIVSLAKNLAITKQATGEAVRQLEKLQYVTKNVSPTDARSYIVVLDKRGMQLIEDAARLKKTIEREYRQLLGEEVFGIFIQALQQLSSHGELRDAAK